MKHGFKQLLDDRGFHGFLWTQFLGALNDNLCKMAVSLRAVHVAATTGSGGEYLALSGAVFVLPFLLSATVQPPIIIFVVIYGLDWVATVPPKAGRPPKERNMGATTRRVPARILSSLLSSRSAVWKLMMMSSVQM